MGRLIGTSSRNPGGIWPREATSAQVAPTSPRRAAGIAQRRSDVERGRPPKAHGQQHRHTLTAMALETLCGEMDGKNVLVIGSAPLDKPLNPPACTYTIVVNGAVSSLPDRFPNLWIVNSRIKPMEHWSRERRFLHTEMMRQAAKRHVRTVAFLTRQPTAEHFTAEQLKEQGTTFEKAVVISRHDRERLEWQSGARTTAMKKDACSAGVFAAIVALWCGAKTVHLEGISFGLGYHYLPGRKMPLNQRAHVQGDRLALRELAQRYPGRITGAMVPGWKPQESVAS